MVRNLRLNDVDLVGRRLTLNGVTRELDDLGHQVLTDWGDEDQRGAVQLGGSEHGHALKVLGGQREDGRMVTPAEVDVAGAVGEDPTMPAQVAEGGAGRDERVLPC